MLKDPDISRSFASRAADDGTRRGAGARTFLSRLEPGRWAVRAAFFTGCLALLATSGPPKYRYAFDAEPLTFTTDLTPDTPTRVYRITLRAESLGVDRVSTTSNASATVHGTIAIAGLDQGAPTPFVAFDAYDLEPMTQAPPHTPVNALTEISKTFTPTFAGDCRNFDPADPCVATLIVELSRTDDGASGGLVNVPWSLALSASADKPGAPNVGPVELPWTVSVEEM